MPHRYRIDLQRIYKAILWIELGIELLEHKRHLDKVVLLKNSNLANEHREDEEQYFGEQPDPIAHWPTAVDSRGRYGIIRCGRCGNHSYQGTSLIHSIRARRGHPSQFISSLNWRLRVSLVRFEQPGKRAHATDERRTKRSGRTR